MHNLYILALATGSLLVAGMLVPFILYIAFEDSGNNVRSNRARTLRDNNGA
jgi:hypothetical protein